MFTGDRRNNNARNLCSGQDLKASLKLDHRGFVIVFNSSRDSCSVPHGQASRLSVCLLRNITFFPLPFDDCGTGRLRDYLTEHSSSRHESRRFFAEMRGPSCFCYDVLPGLSLTSVVPLCRTTASEYRTVFAIQSAHHSQLHLLLSRSVHRSRESSFRMEDTAGRQRK